MSKEIAKIVFPTFEGEFAPNVESRHFPDGECYVRIPNIASYKGKQVLIFHRMYPHQDSAIVQLLLALEELTKQTKNVEAFIPYFPYARQDKHVLEGEVKSSEVLCKMLSNAGLKRLIVLDCHFLKKEGEFEYGGLKIKNLSAAEHLISHFMKKDKELMVVSPDKGAHYLVSRHGGYAMSKKRGGYVGLEEGVVHRNVESLEADFDVSGKSVLVIDDLISGGGTIENAVRKCREGGAKQVYCAATHGQFLHIAAERISGAGASEILTTDSIKNAHEKIRAIDVLKDAMPELF